MLQKNPYGKFFFEFHARVLQNKSFINVESRLALIMKGMNNQFLFGIGLQRTPAPWFLWPCLPMAHDDKYSFCDVCEKKSEKILCKNSR